MRLEYLSFGTVRGAKEKGLGLVCCSPVTLCNCEMASNNDLSPERKSQRGREGERSARNATGILRGGFAGERRREEEKGEKPNVPQKTDCDIIDDDDNDIGNGFARCYGGG